MKEKIKEWFGKLTKKKLLIILGVVLAVVVAVLLFVWLLLRYEKVPKDALVMVDANDKASIEKAGFLVDRKDRKKTKYAAKWEVEETPDFAFADFPTDISKCDTLNFRIKLVGQGQARIMFYFGSENPKTEEADFYSYTMTVKPGEWQDYAFDMSKLVTYGEPLGLDKLTEISIRTTGWRNKADAGSVIRFGHIYLTGDPVKLDSLHISTDGEKLFPHFTQAAIDEAAELAAKPVGWPQYDNGAGLDASPNSYPAEKCTNALYYLALAVRYNELDGDADPLYASNGMLCKDAVTELLEFFLRGGNEPMASPGPHWGHAVMSSALLLIKNTDVIYDSLSQDTRDRMDWMMRAMAVACNWGYNEANNYSSGLDLHGNFGKYWNMNFQNSYLTVMVNAAMYFGREDLDNMLVEFDYDTYMDKFREYKFINVIYAWETAGKVLMETGVAADGENPRTVASYGGNTVGDGDDPAGTGKGVKQRFRFEDTLNGGTISLADEDFIQKLFAYQVASTYRYEVKSENGKPGDKDYCYILGDYLGEVENPETGEMEKRYTARTSPFEGRLGMFTELNASDSHGKRCCLVYPYDSFEILTTLYTNMKLFGGWDSSTQDMQALDEQIYVGNEDYIFRAEYGHRGWASGGPALEYEWSEEYRGNLFIKDIWKNFHCDWDGDVRIKSDPEQPEIVDLPDAEPLGGVTSAPDGALEAVKLYNNYFAEEAYTSIGQLSSGTIKFDIVIGNDVLGDGNVTYDAVVAILRRGSGSRTWSDTNMSVQLQGQLLKFRSGSRYALTGFQFESNYRFHVELTFDAVKKRYSTTVYQIYPTVGEVYTCEDIPFRVGSDLNNYVDTIAVVKVNDTSDMWVENLYVNDKLVKGTDVSYSQEIVNVKDEEAPNTKLRVNTKIWREFTDYTKGGQMEYVNKETVVITASDRASELASLQYCTTSKPMSEAAIQKYTEWTDAQNGVACFKLEPYKGYYVYVKAVDSEGNVGYVSNHILLDPDIPTVSGITSGKTYCEEQTVAISDRYLVSVTLNGEEIIDQLSDQGTYTLEKNSGKSRIIAIDRAGNRRRVTVRVSDTTLKDKVILGKDNPTKEAIGKMGWTVENAITFKDAEYSAKWRVDNSYRNIAGPTGDLEDYKELHFSIMIAPKNNVSSVNFMVYFGSKNTEDGKMQYYPAFLTVPTNTWQEITVTFDEMEYNKSRNPEWSAIDYFRIQANGWSDGKTTIEQGSTVYIGYMYLTAREEDRVHAKDLHFEYVPSIVDPAKHDYKYTCCDTVVRSEPHVKAADSDYCSVCGHDMNTSLKISAGDKEWSSLLDSPGDTYYTNGKRFTVTAVDNGFGVAKLEYAISSTFAEDMATLSWKQVENPYIYPFTSENEPMFIYARTTDSNGKVTYVSTNAIVFDKTSPDVTGISNGTAYCEPPTITVKDANLKGVMVGGKAVTLDADGQYTFEENCGTREVVVTDKAGNATTMTVTVRDTILADKVISPETVWKVNSSEKSFLFVEEASAKGIDIAGYQKLTFRMKVDSAKGSGAPTMVKLQMRLWSHTYYEYLVTVRPGQWQDVTVNLYDPANIGGNMSLYNVRLLALIALDGDADVALGSTIRIQNLRLQEARVHANPIRTAYMQDQNDNTKHILRYECCDTVVGREAHTIGKDGYCIYCTPPVIAGVEEGKTYCAPPTITVRDNTALAYVKVNGSKVALDENGSYTLPGKNGTYNIEAMDEYANKTKVTLKVLSIPLEAVKLLRQTFTYDFEPEANRNYTNFTATEIGELLASYDTLKFTVNVTSNQLDVGTKVDFWLRLYITGSDYYMYRQEVTVGQVNQIEFNLSQYADMANRTSGYTPDLADVASIWFQGDWGNSQLQYCAIEVSDMILTGLHRERIHTFDQEVQEEKYRVDPTEEASGEHGLHYYKSCVCGLAGTEIFEGVRPEKKVWFETDFDTLDGWNLLTAWRYGASWNPNWWEYPDRVSKANFEGRDVLRFASSNYAYHRAVKSIATTGMKDLTVEVDILSPNGQNVSVGLVDITPGENGGTYQENNTYRIGETMWRGAPTEWTRVKIQLSLRSNGAIATAYTKPADADDSEYQVVSGWKDVAITSDYTGEGLLNVCLYSEFGGGAAVYFDHMALYSYVVEETDPGDEAENEKKTVFSADFENIDTALVVDDLWTQATAWRYGANWNPNWWEYPDKVFKAAREDRKVLQFSSSNYAYYRVVKSVSTAGVKEMTMEFDVLSPNGQTVRFGLVDLKPEGNTAYNEKNQYKIGESLWAGAPKEWTRVRIVFNVLPGGVTATAYTKNAADEEAEFEVDSMYSRYLITESYSREEQLNLCLYSEFGNGNTVCFDNVEISAYGKKTKDVASAAKTEATASIKRIEAEVSKKKILLGGKKYGIKNGGFTQRCEVL